MNVACFRGMKLDLLKIPNYMGMIYKDALGKFFLWILDKSEKKV